MPSAESTSNGAKAQSQPHTINITPNYGAMFDAYVAQVELSASTLAKKLATVDAPTTTEHADWLLSMLNGLCFSINMAAQCMTTEAEVVRFRTATFGALTGVHEQLEAFRAAHDEDAED